MVLNNTLIQLQFTFYNSYILITFGPIRYCISKRNCTQLINIGVECFIMVTLGSTCGYLCCLCTQFMKEVARICTLLQLFCIYCQNLWQMLVNQFIFCKATGFHHATLLLNDSFLLHFSRYLNQRCGSAILLNNKDEIKKNVKRALL